MKMAISCSQDSLPKRAIPFDGKNADGMNALHNIVKTSTLYIIVGYLSFCGKIIYKEG
jgi:hypothetical protein